MYVLIYIMYYVIQLKRKKSCMRKRSVLYRDCDVGIPYTSITIEFDQVVYFLQLIFLTNNGPVL